MKKRHLDPNVVIKWAKVIKIVFFVIIGLIIILGIINRMSFAAPGPGEPVGSATDLSDWVRNLFDISGYLVGGIAVIMIIIAGITYALDLGGGKQIGLAKDMIISTISGVILFMLAAWLLNEIGGENGLFPPQDVPATNPSAPSTNLPPSSGVWDIPSNQIVNDEQMSNVWNAFGPDIFK